MEGRGFLEAVHINSILGTVIRGVSDLLSGKSDADEAGWQRKAADAASAVAFEMLATLTPGPPEKPAASTPEGDGEEYYQVIQNDKALPTEKDIPLRIFSSSDQSCRWIDRSSYLNCNTIIPISDIP
jgi:hypothetical protein